jgi:hypothetical protein
MKIMVVWKTVPGQYKTAFDQLLKTGGPWRSYSANRSPKKKSAITSSLRSLVS